MALQQQPESKPLDAAMPLFTNQYKILMLGDSGVGKSSILLRYTNGQFTANFLPTIGIDFKNKLLEVPDQTGKGKHTVRLQLWDTAGQDRFRAITRQYIRGCHGIVLCYDCTARYTFENVDRWLAVIEEMDAGTSPVTVLVANKCDQSKAQTVSDEEGQALAEERGIRFFKSSAKDNVNVEKIFFSITVEIEKRNIYRRSTMERLSATSASTANSAPIILGRNVSLDDAAASNNPCCSGSGASPVKRN